MREAMSMTERLETVLSGGVPDRVPVIPLVYYFAARCAGISSREFLTSMRSFRRAMDICFYEAGPWDAMYPLPLTMDAPHFDITWGAGLGMKPELPDGGEDATHVLQATEARPLMREDDYLKILSFDFPGPAYPLLRFMVELISRYSGKPPDLRLWLSRFVPNGIRLGVRWAAERERWRLRGVPFFISFSLEAPFDTFSMGRGLTGFAIDLRRRPDEIAQAALKLARSMAHVALLACRVMRTNRFLLCVHRSSNDFISPKQFEQCSYPSIKYIAEYLNSRGIYFGMHNDGNWDRNLELMTGLPEGTYFQFDGRTDIFKAREVLGDSFTIMGDVPATMLAFGTPHGVDEYCGRLIEQVGAKGRFILSSGCEIPQDARLENVRAMVNAARTYGR